MRAKTVGAVHTHTHTQCNLSEKKKKNKIEEPMKRN